MSTIKLRRSDQAGNVPLTGNLALGEVALNTYDGKLFFKKTVDTTDSIVTLQPFPDGGSPGQILSVDLSGNLAWINSSASGLTIRNTAGNGGVVGTTVTGISSLNFDQSAGFTITEQDSGNVFVSYSSAGSNAPLKTFNVIGDFSQLTGTARFYPIGSDTIRSVILSVAKPVTENLLMGLYRNNEFVQYFNIAAGQNYASFTDLNIPIQPNESYTVNIVTGYGTNLSMALFNINI